MHPAPNLASRSSVLQLTRTDFGEFGFEIATGFVGGAVGAFLTTLVVGAIAPDYTERMMSDVLELDPSAVPACECCFTSPPFMVRGMETNPFENYAGQSSYEDYLDDVETAFSRVAEVIADGGRLVVDVVNVKHEGRVTTLAWDVAERIETVLDFDGEVVVTWEGGDDDRTGNYGYGYDHSYCLVFTKPGSEN